MLNEKSGHDAPSLGHGEYMREMVLGKEPIRRTLAL